MAYNSDGYIMIDFTEVDFRRTTQTIEGLYKRCVDVIGTNKFILVINANGRTPLPATCSFTNNQYVIDTVIYMFAVSSNDNLFIRRNDVPASDIIDDSSISVDKTWSSNKIVSELDTKQNVLTPGDYMNISNDVISWTGVKSFKYTGNGSVYSKIYYPSDCHMILFIDGDIVSSVTPKYNYSASISPIPIRKSGTMEGTVVLNIKNATTRSQVPWHIIFHDDYIACSSSSNDIYNMNQLDVEYTVFYI